MFADLLHQVSTLQVLSWVLYVGALIYVGRQISLSELRKNKKLQHLLFGSAASIFVLWIFRTGIYDGLNVHFLWLTALVLLLGLRWAFVSASIALLGLTVVGLEPWSMLGVNGLIGVAAPLVISYLIYTLSFHYLPRHLFVYIFICAFLPGAAMIAIKMFLLGGYYVLDGAYDWTIVSDNYLALIPLMLFSEGMLNGMTVTLLIIYKPTWVYTFYDKFYIQDK